ncbi:MAG: RNA polymerase subunit sigma-24 [Chloroflexi bacterium HGW-Chloroflexi-3]|nr:MAG: RNA polymerase subunit sigma-24 [Chloroflexi bacterium HGW-Chloroflexi-3]
MDEQSAIKQLKQGDIQGLKTLVEIYEVRAVHAVVLIVGDRGQAEDIVQNAFIRIFERIEQYDTKRPFGPWFFRIVVNDALKTTSKQKRLTSLDTDNVGHNIQIRDPLILPEQRFEVQELKQQIWLLVQQLPPNQSAAIVLRYYLELPERDIAEFLHSPVGTVKWWLHSAKKSLAKALKT